MTTAFTHAAPTQDPGEGDGHAHRLHPRSVVRNKAEVTA